MLGSRLVPRNLLTRHSDPQLQGAWNLTQLALLLFPTHGVLGGVLLVLAAISVYRQRWPEIQQWWVNRAWALLAFWLIITAALADRPLAAFLGLANFLPPMLMFAMLVVLIQTPAQLRHLAWLLTFNATVVTTLGIGQQFFGWSGPSPGKLFEPLLGWLIAPTGNPPGRMASVFMYANSLAVYALMVLPLTIALLLQPRSRDCRRLGYLAAVTIALVIALVFTNSRSAWATGILVGVAYGVYLGWYWLLGLGGLLSGLLGWSAFGSSPSRDWLRRIVPPFFWARLSDEMYPNRPVAELRRTQWQFALKLWQQRPINGWGIRNFSPLYEQHTQLWLGHPHNLPLMMLSETGLVGTLLLFGIVGRVITQASLLCFFNPSSPTLDAAQCREEAADRLILLGYLLAFLACTLFNLLDISLLDLRVNVLGWFCLAAISGLVYHQK